MIIYGSTSTPQFVFLPELEIQMCQNGSPIDLQNSVLDNQTKYATRYTLAHISSTDCVMSSMHFLIASQASDHLADLSLPSETDISSTHSSIGLPLEC